MKHRSVLTSPSVILVAGLICMASVVQARAQAAAHQTRTFGSSLKKPKAGTLNM